MMELYIQPQIRLEQLCVELVTAWKISVISITFIGPSHTAPVVHTPYKY